MLAMLALESGQIFYGRSIGVSGIRTGEVVFNTALTGYQEVLTDPSYTQQIITFTYPHIGNTGINFEDHQSQTQKIFAAGLIVKSLSRYVSNWRSKISLAEFLQQQQVVGIEGIDTRGLTKLLRENGALRGCIMAGIVDEQYAIQQANAYAGLNNLDLTGDVATTTVYQIPGKLCATPMNIVLVDFGVKKGILNCLTERGCNITVVPANTRVPDILALKPDGILLGNGPGDPAACLDIIQNIKALIISEIPLFGICLGHQLLALALGANTYKMSFGHHGNNHPVFDTRNNRVMITSQNHGFAVDEITLDREIEITHRSLFDHSLQGFKHRRLPIFGFQGHPEGSPGPSDAMSLFDEFIHAVRNSNATSFEFA